MAKKLKNWFRSRGSARTVALITLTLVLSTLLVPLFSISSSAYVNNDDVFYFYVLNDGGTTLVHPDVTYYYNSYGDITYAGSTNDLLLMSPIPSEYHIGYKYYYGGPVTVDLSESYIDVSNYVYYNRLWIYGIDKVVAIKVFDGSGNLVSWNDTPNSVPSFDVNSGYYYLIYTKSGDSSIPNITADVRFNLAVNSTGGGGSAGDDYDIGYEDGYSDGYDLGYSVGFNDGYDNANIDFIFNTIVDPVSALFNFELLPSISIGSIFATILGISLVLLFLKYFAGG